jgi:DNA-binding transcriptional LysR family regulator
MNFDKIKYFIHLVEKERTGTAKAAAEKIGVSERMIFNYVNLLKNQLNAPISYNREKQSFVFTEKGSLFWKWVKQIE